MLLERIHTDHKHISKLLNLLDKKAIRLEDGEAINLNFLRDVIDYLQRYADHSHHPMEDILYHYYLDKNGGSQGAIHRLEEEHAILREATDQLMDTLNMILNDAVVPRDRLIANIKDFAAMQRRHLAQEEEHVLPKLEKELTDEDWQKVEQRVSETLIKDPLFNNEKDSDYDELRAYLADLGEI
ncbi:hemerythrin domain-containing protein [Ferrimonas gelatinilytica]|uniref:Hemerythrin domain-containing protein n=1 Tax=Ferrimonas gelatinilytica TaxID=1255257 RepID=A0ABP9S4R3_9GAMM